MDWPVIPTYRVLSRDGQVLDPSHEPPELANDKEHLIRIYKHMLALNVMDSILYEAQRQGRISFYVTSYGEEATLLGSAAALRNEDEVFAQYREQGILLYRGFTFDQFMAQCYGNQDDPAKGRQMPVHYGSAALHYQTISAPLGTQIPQASGAGYRFKLQKKDQIAVCYFGEGAASEGDFHAALNIAATTDSQTLFFCRNNGYAISTPADDQYRGDGIAARGQGYGIATIRVDGNDFLAVYNATKKARRLIVEQQRPALIEALSYRVSHHSTSDDSSAYRSDSEVEAFKTHENPVTRFRRYLERKGYWKREQDATARKELRSDILKAFTAAEKKKRAPLSDMFRDVLAGPNDSDHRDQQQQQGGPELPWNLQEQREELKETLDMFPSAYRTEGYEGGTKGLLS